jgi:arsenate reductase (thioredoxin)
MGSLRTVVFVCQHGAAMSVLAAALLERLAADHGLLLRVLARGTEPEPQVAPAVGAGLLEQGIDVAAWQPRPLTPGDLAGAWRVVFFGPDLSHLLPNEGVRDALQGGPTAQGSPFRTAFTPATIDHAEDARPQGRSCDPTTDPRHMFAT